MLVQVNAAFFIRNVNGFLNVVVLKYLLRPIRGNVELKQCFSLEIVNL